MTTQEHAFHRYYASMTDAELLQTAANRRSLIEVAQRVLADEIERRHLVEQVAGPAQRGPEGEGPHPDDHAAPVPARELTVVRAAS